MLLTHYTDNPDAVRKSRILKCGLSLMTEHGKENLATVKREKPAEIARGVVLRDHDLTGRIEFCQCTTLPEFVKHLNKHVFFWASSAAGEGCRLTFRDKYPQSVGLWCCLDDLQAKNPGAEILYSPVNSGTGARFQPQEGRRLRPRCLNLFKPLRQRGSDRPVEVIAQGEVKLPDNTMRECEDGTLRRFFSGSR